MKKNMKYFVMAAMTLMSMSACNNEMDEQAPVSQGKAVSFQMGLATTRTTTGTDYVTKFVKGDAVGVFAYERNTDGTEGAVAVTNAKYVLNDTEQKWIAADPTNAAYADATTAFNYYAYYPYEEGVTTPSSVAMAVKLDQSTAAATNYNISDALTARNKAVAANSTTVQLTFKHAFALVQVTLEGIAADKAAIVTMQNVFPGANLNLQHADDAQAAGNANGTQSTIKMFSMSENQTATKGFAFRAIVPAQNINANTTLLEIQSLGKTYRFSYSTAVAYEAGKIRQMKVTLGDAPEKNTITISASDITIDPWGNTTAGGGSGSTEEVLALMPALATSTVFNMYYASASPTLANSWFSITKSADVGALQQTTVAVATDNSNLVITYKLDASAAIGWNNSAIGFTTTQCTKGIYKLSFDLKVDNIIGNELSSATKVGLSVFARSAGYKDAENSGFAVKNGKLIIDTENPANNKGASLEYATLTTGDSWTPISISFDLSKTVVGAATATATSYTATTDEAIAKVHFAMTYNGTNKLHPIHIRSLKLEKVVE